MTLANRSLFTGAALGAAAALVIGFAPAVAQQGGGRPATIATVQLSTVMDKLDQWADSLANLNAMGAKVRAEDAQRKEALTKLQTQLEDARKANPSAPPTREMTAMQEDLALKSLQYQAWSRFTLDQVDIEKALLLQDLYRNIKMAAAQMAGSNGYDLVLVDDAHSEIKTTTEARISREAQVYQQIVARRMLHANPALDITDELITRMNNAHKAAGGAAATAPNP
jgi:Skp family chaperone for outer membrane proteins